MAGGLIVSNVIYFVRWHDTVSNDFTGLVTLPSGGLSSKNEALKSLVFVCSRLDRFSLDIGLICTVNVPFAYTN